MAQCKCTKGQERLVEKGQCFQHEDERHGVLDESGEVFGFTNKECYFRQGIETETREKPLDTRTGQIPVTHTNR